MPKITINGKEIEFERNDSPSSMRAADVEIPRFCYYEKLSIAGNCRMCLSKWINHLSQLHLAPCQLQKE